MDRLVIEGGRPLGGEVRVSGAKNAALPLLCASLLTPEPVVLTNVPRLNDVRTMQTLLAQMGVRLDTREAGTVALDASAIDWPLAPYELVKTMRASILALGPLVARSGEARVSLPGGCAIGLRPVDQHVKGLEAMGAEIDLEHGYISARAKRLAGTRFVFDLVTVTGTENLMMAATLALGTTTLENAAREPEIVDLARCLTAMGARIVGAGSDRITIEGVTKLHGTTHSIMPDRIETGTFLAAVAAAGGEATLTGTEAATLDAVRDEAGRGGRDHYRDGRCNPHRAPQPARGIHAPHGALPVVSDRHAGADDGRGGLCRRDVDDHRDDLREPDDARAGAYATRRRHRRRGQHGDRARRTEADRGNRHGHGPARLRVPRDRGARGRRRNDDRPDLSSRSRLRKDRGQAVGARRAHSPRARHAGLRAGGATAMTDLRESPLGHATSWAEGHDARLLFPVDRAPLRAELGLAETLPFRGVDVWNCYELSWLDAKGKPEVAVATFEVPADSPRIVESKSVKLYLTALNLVRFASRQEVAATIERDLSWATGAAVALALHGPEAFGSLPRAELAGASLDAVPLEAVDRAPDPDVLRAEGAPISEALVTRLFRSVCPVTGQPDYASLQLRYRGARIDRVQLLRYFVSFRRHPGFHEHCVERIFTDVWTRCRPEALTVYARFTRRGGIDINPFRASGEGPPPSNARTARQ